MNGSQVAARLWLALRLFKVWTGVTSYFSRKTLQPVTQNFNKHHSGVSDRYPNLEEVAPRIFRLPGATMPLYITPDRDHCGQCGKRTKSKWCIHLISAGLKLKPPIIVEPKVVILYWKFFTVRDVFIRNKLIIGDYCCPGQYFESKVQCFFFNLIILKIILGK